jgi:hypothetical protein
LSRRLQKNGEMIAKNRSLTPHATINREAWAACNKKSRLPKIFPKAPTLVDFDILGTFAIFSK